MRHDSSLWHTLIEADNYHALQLLEWYLYAGGELDCIYIDPPPTILEVTSSIMMLLLAKRDQYRHSK